MRNASLEDCQLLAESKILQRDLFVAAKDQKNHPKKREDCVQHEAGSVSASSLKINRLRDRWDLARRSHGIRHRCRKLVLTPAQVFHTRQLLAGLASSVRQWRYATPVPASANK